MKTKTVARFAMLTALALVLGYLESLIPIAPTIPGIKLGLGNTVLLYAVYMASPLESAMLMVCKVALSSLMFGGGFSAMLYSLAGGILSLAVMLLLVRLPKVGVIGVSACGAICHNLGQIAMASLILGVGAVWAYFPVLVISGLVMGPITGAVAKSVFAALKKSGTEFYINPKTFQESKAADIIIISVMLVLSGGASRGFAHVGVIKVLEAQGIPIDIIVGTSAGSLTGALYAYYADAAALENAAAFDNARLPVTGEHLSRLLPPRIAAEAPAVVAFERLKRGDEVRLESREVGLERG